MRRSMRSRAKLRYRHYVYRQRRGWDRKQPAHANALVARLAERVVELAGTRLGLDAVQWQSGTLGWTDAGRSASECSTSPGRRKLCALAAPGRRGLSAGRGTGCLPACRAGPSLGSAAAAGLKSLSRAHWCSLAGRLRRFPAAERANPRPWGHARYGNTQPSLHPAYARMTISCRDALKTSVGAQQTLGKRERLQLSDFPALLRCRGASGRRYFLLVVVSHGRGLFLC